MNFENIKLLLLEQKSWMLSPSILFIAAITLTYVFRFAYRSVIKQLQEKEYHVVYAAVSATFFPTLLYVWFQLILAILKLFETKLQKPIVAFISTFHGAVTIMLFSWAFFRFIQIFEAQLLEGKLTKKQPDSITVQAVGRLLRVAALSIVVLSILSRTTGLDLSGIIAIGGGSAIVVGIAVRPILSNYFGGMLIYSGRLFKPGDWIHSPDKEIEGTVENIGWHSTCIRTFYKQPLYVPNAVFADITIINASRMSNRRIKETFGIRYSDASKLATITDQIRMMLEEHPGIDQNQTLLVHFIEFGPSSLNIEIYTFTKTTNWKLYREVQQDVFLKCVEIIEKNGAKLAIPANMLHLADSIRKEGQKSLTA